ncbi:outer membrane protein OprJ [Pseudorhodoferax aquiterrae]|uniref:Outer membrane protein OprJ n=1 Tax=Pseudorhodoferax aquiterrae TaxID=747304 RepID=A0ABQ3G697_9BURK|nr:efflux transporter outer membrane subunit [Pseudorhodoferax aquiterrae]GHC91235.1 outer membrane protein OprJ [Pseudorhodoferax aquiterrae]
MSEHPLLRCAALALALLATGCSLVPAYERPATPLPAHWDTQAAAAACAPGSASTATPGWQDFVADPQLRALVARALANNRSLRQTLLDVQAARALYRVQRAEQLPGLQAEAGGQRQRLPEDLRAPGTPAVQSSLQAGVGLAAFELDLFGRVRALSEAALQEVLATEEAALAARVSLVAEVVQAAAARQGARQRLQLARQTLLARERALDLVLQRHSAGAATALDVQEARGLVHAVAAQHERIAREERQAGHALALLVGDPAGEPATGDGPLLRQDLGAGLPSELLARRPDIRAAEHRLRARHAHIGAARAAFFPRIALTGLFGSASADLSGLFGAGQRSWSFAPQLTLPLFDGGRNAANLDLALLRKDQAVAAYELSIQTAFREVADALAATETLRREEAAQRALADTSGEALRLAQARWEAGADDHLRYLDAQRSALAAQMDWIAVRTAHQVALATLFRALGGGWQATPPS